MQQQKRADNAGGNCQPDHDRRTPAAEKQQQHADRQQSADDDDILVDQVNGRVDVVGFVVGLDQFQAVGGKHVLVQSGRHVAEALHRVQHVGARLPNGVDGDARGAEVLDHSCGLLVAEFDFSHVTDIDGKAVTSGDDHVGDLLGGCKLPHHADDVSPFPVPDVTGGPVAILFAQGAPHVG